MHITANTRTHNHNYITGMPKWDSEKKNKVKAPREKTRTLSFHSFLLAVDGNGSSWSTTGSKKCQSII